MTDDELKETFESYGEVSSARIITDRETSKSRGFGFVEFSEKAHGDAAIEALNGQEIGGRTLVVNEARPQKPKPSGGPRYR